MGVENQEKLYLPHLEIEYADAKTEEILKVGSNKYDTVLFTSEYYMDTAGFWYFAETIFIILIVVMVMSVFL